MNCIFCKKGGAKSRRTKGGDRLYIEPTCDSCTQELVGDGFDIVLAPKNVVGTSRSGGKRVHYPILKSILPPQLK